MRLEQGCSFLVSAHRDSCFVLGGGGGLGLAPGAVDETILVIKGLLTASGRWVE